MSSELTESNFVRRPSVASIISEPIGWISFKFWFLLPRAICPEVFYFWKKKRFKIFGNFWFLDYVSKNFKKLLLHQITLESFFNLFLKFLLSCPHKSTAFDFWNFEFLIFNDFSKFSVVWGNQKPQLSGKLATVEQNLEPWGEYSVHTGYFWQLSA